MTFKGAFNSNNSVILLSVSWVFPRTHQAGPFLPSLTSSPTVPATHSAISIPIHTGHPYSTATGDIPAPSEPSPRLGIIHEISSKGDGEPKRQDCKPQRKQRFCPDHAERLRKSPGEKGSLLLFFRHASDLPASPAEEEGRTEQRLPKNSPSSSLHCSNLYIPLQVTS